MQTPILGSSYVARSINAADNRMVNLYPEATPENGKDAGFLNRAPGLRLLAPLGGGPVRGLWQVGAWGRFSCTAARRRGGVRERLTRCCVPARMCCNRSCRL